MAERGRGVLELFCGIGGCAAALRPGVRVVAAIDQNRTALGVYAGNFPHPISPRAIETIPLRDWRRWEAVAWWLSPPCPPYTTRGLGRDIDDPRARSFVALVDRMADVRPPYVAFENVPGFVDSRGHDRLRNALARAGYAVRETLLCPSSLGLPNRRRRFYVVAGLEELLPWPAASGPPTSLRELLDAEPDRALWCDAALVERYAGALNVVRADDEAACSACFTAAYGRSPVRSGSYLATAAGLRRFSPAEMLRLLDFPRNYRLPPGLPLRVAWPLVGNSLSVRAVRWVLAAIPGLSEWPPASNGNARGC